MFHGQGGLDTPGAIVQKAVLKKISEPNLFQMSGSSSLLLSHLLVKEHGPLFLKITDLQKIFLVLGSLKGPIDCYSWEAYTLPLHFMRGHKPKAFVPVMLYLKQFFLFNYYLWKM